MISPKEYFDNFKTNLLSESVIKTMNNLTIFIAIIFLILCIGDMVYSLLDFPSFLIFLSSDILALIYYFSLIIIIVLITLNKFNKKIIYSLLLIFTIDCLISIYFCFIYWDSTYWILSYCPNVILSIICLISQLIIMWLVVFKKYLKVVDFLALSHLVLGFFGLIYFIQYNDFFFTLHYLFFHCAYGIMILLLFPTEGFTKVFCYKTSASKLARRLIIFVPLILAILTISGVLFIESAYFSFITLENDGVLLSGVLFTVVIIFIIVYINLLNNKDVVNQEYLDKTLAERETLLVEVHHRVKNNMQLIISLLHLESRKYDDEAILKTLDDLQNRIRAMSLVHENLYQTFDFDSMNLKYYVSDLINTFKETYASDNINFEFDIEEININPDLAITIGLIINEIINNSIKYAFPDDREGTIFMELYKEGDYCILEIGDDGVGLNNSEKVNNSTGLGSILIESFVDQIDGELEFNSDDLLIYIIKFPINQ